MTVGQGSDRPAAFVPGGDQYVLDSLYQINPLMMGDLMSYIENNPPAIPISQISGYTAQTPYSAPSIAAEETTSSATFVNLNTVGPQLTALPDGLYTITFGATAKISTSVTRARMCISVNGAAPDLSIQAYTQATGSNGIAFSTSLRVSGGTGGNIVLCQYSIGVAPATATFGGRYLSAVRISGP